MKKLIMLVCLLGLLAFGATAIAETKTFKPKKAMKYATNVNWKQHTFVDDFRDPTKDEYIRYEAEGLFFNSATANTICYVHILVDYKNKVAIFIREYNRRQPYVWFIRDNSYILMKNSKGQKFRCDVISIWNNKGGLHIKCQIPFINFLKKSVGFVKVMIYDGNDAVYEFKINADGFTTAYNGIRPAKKGE